MKNSHFAIGVIIAIIFSLSMSFAIVKCTEAYKNKQVKEAQYSNRESIGKILEVIPMPGAGWGRANYTRIICEKATVVVRFFPIIKIGKEGFIVRVHKEGLLCEENIEYFTFNGTTEFYKINF